MKDVWWFLALNNLHRGIHIFSGFVEHVTVLIGVAVGGKAVAGVMHQPYYKNDAHPDAPLGRTMWAIVGLGQRLLLFILNLNTITKI